ncbi:hypothetical protein [Paludisphaera soli]|uniref:hypothetical protein n=1 Tax=Paludisphaera soli TaxID=2712865 RepID=UPI0013E9F5BB|nr:hypothetical protein [Paludisphaera soli]
MARRIVLGTLSLLTLGVGPGEAQEPPALEAPAQASADAPPIPPPAEAPPGRDAEPPRSRPLLVIPGVTAPDPSRTARKPAADAAAATTAPATPPALDGPDPGPGIPLRLESIPDEPAEPGRAGAPSRREDEVRGTTRPDASSASRKPGTGLGRLLGGAGNAQGGRDALSIESKGDPAVEAAVKRRVEKQVQEALGDRVKDVQVRVSGRSVSIRARPSRFWHRWGARRALDALPMPSGYRAHVDLID